MPLGLLLFNCYSSEDFIKFNSTAVADPIQPLRQGFVLLVFPAIILFVISSFFTPPLNQPLILQKKKKQREPGLNIYIKPLL